VGILAIILVFCMMVIGCDNGTTEDRTTEDTVPDLLSAEWKTLDTAGWEAWMEENKNATAEQQQEITDFLNDHFNDLSADGKAFWEKNGVTGKPSSGGGQRNITITGLDAYNGKPLIVYLSDPNIPSGGNDSLVAGNGESSLPAITNGSCTNIPLVTVDFNTDDVFGGPFTGSGSYHVYIRIRDPSGDDSYDYKLISKAPISFASTTTTVAYSSSTFDDMSD
jgi:hypothetical protein